MTDAKNWAQRMARRLLQSLPTRPSSALPPQNHEFLGAVTQGLGGAGRTMTKTQQLLSLRPTSRPHDLQWLEKGVLNRSLQPQLVRISLPGQGREQGPGTKGGVRLPREENPITWNSANSSQFTPPLGAAILDKHEVPAPSQSPRSKGVRGAA